MHYLLKDKPWESKKKKKKKQTEINLLPNYQ